MSKAHSSPPSDSSSRSASSPSACSWSHCLCTSRRSPSTRKPPTVASTNAIYQAQVDELRATGGEHRPDQRRRRTTPLADSCDRPARRRIRGRSRRAAEASGVSHRRRHCGRAGRFRRPHQVPTPTVPSRRRRATPRRSRPTERDRAPADGGAAPTTERRDHGRAASRSTSRSVRRPRHGARPRRSSTRCGPVRACSAASRRRRPVGRRHRRRAGRRRSPTSTRKDDGHGDRRLRDASCAGARHRAPTCTSLPALRRCCASTGTWCQFPATPTRSRRSGWRVPLSPS